MIVRGVFVSIQVIKHASRTVVADHQKALYLVPPPLDCDEEVTVLDSMVVV